MWLGHPGGWHPRGLGNRCVLTRSLAARWSGSGGQRNAGGCPSRVRREGGGGGHRWGHYPGTVPALCSVTVSGRSTPGLNRAAEALCLVCSLLGRKKLSARTHLEIHWSGHSRCPVGTGSASWLATGSTSPAEAAWPAGGGPGGRQVQGWGRAHRQGAGKGQGRGVSGPDPGRTHRDGEGQEGSFLGSRTLRPRG